MLEVLLLGAMIETGGVWPKPVACAFPGEAPNEAPIEVVLTPRPSLKDLPGLYRVEMALNGGLKLSAAAQPITATDDADVMVSASTGSAEYSAFYTVGIDTAGRAALNIQVTGRDETLMNEATRVGICRNHERHLRRWSTS